MDYIFSNDAAAVAETADVLDTVEAVLQSDDRLYERVDNQLAFPVQGQYCTFHGMASYAPEGPAITFQYAMDMRCPAAKRAGLLHLIALMNEAAFIGHIDVGHDDGDHVCPTAWRFTLPLIGRNDINPQEVAAILASGLDLVNRFYPASQYLIWSGKSAEEAAEAALFETSGMA